MLKKIKKLIFISLCAIGLLTYNNQLILAQTDGEKIVQTAKKYIGNPYVWGGNSLTEGCDCSHFVWLVLKEAIDYQDAYATSWGFETLGQEVQNIETASAGDIICYGPHVAIYDGEGKIIEAKGAAYGITYDREATYSSIVTIRRFKKEN